MSETEFHQLADRTLRSLEAAFDAQSDAVEASRSGDVLTVEFDDGSRIVINSQAPMQQIWVAARAGGFHFRYDNGIWLDTRDASTLGNTLSRLASAQASIEIKLDEPSV